MAPVGIGLAAWLVFPVAARAREDFIDLDWVDLIPPGKENIEQRLQGMGILPHDEMSTLRGQQPPSSGVRTDYNGKVVRLPGYMIPPANQLVFVTTGKPYESSGLFEAVNVTGMFGTAATSTQLGDIGYALSADRIEPFTR